MVGDTGSCKISNIKLQRYTNTGPRPGTRPRARDNGKFEISEIQDNESPSVVFLFSRVPAKTFLVSTVEHAEQFTRQATTVVLVHETTSGKTVKYLSVSNFLMACVL